MKAAFFESLTFFIKWRLLSHKFWVVVVAGWAYVYAVLHNFDAPRLTIIGVSVLGALAGHLWGQAYEQPQK